jgi:hypothetical protein
LATVLIFVVLALRVLGLAKPALPIFVLALFMLSVSTFAKDYYVSPEGTGNCQKDNPCKFKDALDLITNKDPDRNPTIIMLEGEYSVKKDFYPMPEEQWKLKKLPNLKVTAEPGTVVIRGEGEFFLLRSEGEMIVENIVITDASVHLDGDKTLKVSNVTFNSCPKILLNSRANQETYNYLYFENNIVNSSTFSEQMMPQASEIYFRGNVFRKSRISLYITGVKIKKVEFTGNRFVEVEPMPLQYSTLSLYAILEVSGINISEVKSR